ncbi:MAG: DUF4252 domain-containing protein [Candidatus Cyclobacteriaceae bacterium M2_1C_046]
MKSIVIVLLIAITGPAYAQSRTTQELHEKYEDSFYMFFYKNTLKMLNQDDNEEFAALIEDIEKMKFLRIDKEKHKFDRKAIRGLMQQYQDDEFEELMSMRDKDADIKVYIKEKDQITHGLVMLINETDNLAILDIKGAVPLNKLASLYDKVKQINP